MSKSTGPQHIKVIDEAHGPDWSIYHGDSCEVIKGIPDNSLHFQVMSPPFSGLYVFSNSDRDISNTRNDAMFFEHYGFLVEEQFRVAMPGRLCAIHCMQVPSSKTHHGHIGIRDFRGDVVRLFQDKGWLFHSEICIWKNPATAMMRTKALGLLHKQIRKDAAMCRQGVADYILVFRKPGDNPERVANDHQSFPVPMWQRYASPVWATADGFDDEGFLCFRDPSNKDQEDESSGIDQTDTLQFRSAREHADEKHIAPLQIGVIRRCIKLWTNPGDIVGSFFGGIGSEGVVALEMGRKAILCELKESYYRMAVANLKTAVSHKQGDLFDFAESAA